eukprot:TRINITY_DN20719_c0_g1_i1.p1 TRINITY_DN20719_c0_g1~~TRINITY_DN20719_c0_g1_i1.p1  ORF type:complete len:142 (+),score=14.74 TRINITY_DN20719_c0_g1_i1:64-489(+)
MCIRDRPCQGQAIVKYGPIQLDYSTRTILEYAIASGGTKINARVDGFRHNFSVAITLEKVEMTSEDHKYLVFPYNADYPNFECSSSDGQSLTIIFTDSHRYSTNLEGFEDPRRIKLLFQSCLLYTSPSPRDRQKSRMPSSA